VTSRLRLQERQITDLARATEGPLRSTDTGFQVRGGIANRVSKNSFYIMDPVSNSTICQPWGGVARIST
jgi:hypothetical protein